MQRAHVGDATGLGNPRHDRGQILDEESRKNPQNGNGNDDFQQGEGTAG